MNSSRKFIHTHTLKYGSILKKKEILSFVATWVTLEGIMVSGISQYRKTNTAWTHIEGIPPPPKKERERTKVLIYRNKRATRYWRVVEVGRGW